MAKPIKKFEKFTNEDLDQNLDESPLSGFEEISIKLNSPIINNNIHYKGHNINFFSENGLYTIDDKFKFKDPKSVIDYLITTFKKDISKKGDYSQEDGQDSIMESIRQITKVSLGKSSYIKTNGYRVSLPSELNSENQKNKVFLIEKNGVHQKATSIKEASEIIFGGKLFESRGGRK
jgi:hypothetical protein